MATLKKRSSKKQSSSTPVSAVATVSPPEPVSAKIEIKPEITVTNRILRNHIHPSNIYGHQTICNVCGVTAQELNNAVSCGDLKQANPPKGFLGKDIHDWVARSSGNVF